MSHVINNEQYEVCTGTPSWPSLNGTPDDYADMTTLKGGDV